MNKRLKSKAAASLVGCFVLIGGALFIHASTTCNCYNEMPDACYEGEYMRTEFEGVGTCASQYSGPSSCQGQVTVYCYDREAQVAYPTQRYSVSDYCSDCDTNGGGGSNGSGTGTGGSVGEGCWNYWCMPNAY